MGKDSLKARCEALYAQYNHPGLIHPDPLEIVRAFPAKADREIAALIASSLAYGRVRIILKSTQTVLRHMNPSLKTFVMTGSYPQFKSIFKGFRHRFTSAEDIAALMAGIQHALQAYGSLEACFTAHDVPAAPTILPGLQGLLHTLRNTTGQIPASLLPDPEKGSAMKRANLFMRWMVRHDAVDPGGWDGVSPARLIIPLDTHIFRVSRALGLTERKAADLKTALEITRALRDICPEDPIRYDFALSRPGISDIQLLY